MLSRLLTVLTLASAMVALGQVAPGENLILNGALEADQVEFPVFWTRNSVERVSYHASGGPGGRPYITLLGKEGEANEITARQPGLKLVAGEKYKMSAWVKTKGFSSKHYGVTVHNSGWYLEDGLKSFPENSDWQFMEATFTMMKSTRDEYGIAVFGVNMRGEFSFADVRLEAVTPAAQQGSRPSEAMLAQAAPRLVAWKPLLNKIPLNDPRLEMHFFGRFPKNAIADYDFVYAVNDGAAVKKPLAKTINTVDLAGLRAGDYALTVSLVQRDSGAAVFTDKHVITLIQPPVIDTSGHRRLNNLVTELLRQPIAGANEQTFAFSNPRDGWVYVACQGGADLPGLQIVLNDGDVAVTAKTDRREAFRQLPAGPHRLTVKGAAGGQLIVRAVPILFNYPPCVNNHLPENPPYDWDWHKKHVLLGVNTLNGGSIPVEHRPEVRERGLVWLSSVGSTNLKDAEDLAMRLQKNPGLFAPHYDGVTCDEQFFGQPSLMLYTDGLRMYDNPNNRLIYTWIVGKPSLSGAHHAFMSASLNASRGRGVLIYEAYCRPRPTKEETMTYLQSYVIDTIQKFNAFFPDAAAGTGIIFGNFNQIPILSLDHDPEVDSKYYLDMQLHLIANDPACAGLGGTGYWGSYYADEEYNRWSFRLLRHYGVEGRTDMLSEQHGFTYRPGHLQNCDFQEGLQGWAVDAAAKGSVRTEKLAGFGKASQGRWGGTGGVGDTVCVLTRQNGPVNSVSQKASGLQVGRLYTLQFVVADYKDAVAKKIDPRRFGLNVALSEGAEVLPEKTYVHVDKRVKGRYAHNDGVARINLHHITFRARQPEVTITFQDTDAAPGEELAFNYVMLKPYYDVE